MIPKKIIKLVQTEKPIAKLVTKFGGQPTWITQPEWPISRATKNPMRFICQIALDDEIIGGLSGSMAFVFTSDYSPEISEWSQESGEAAVIIQPLGCLSQDLETGPIENGPSLFRITKGKRKLLFRKKVRTSCEYAVETIRDEDPDSIDIFESLSMEKKLSQDHLDGNKIGGIPAIMYDIPFSTSEIWNTKSTPQDHKWRFIMQIDQTQDTYRIDFENLSIGYLFVSHDFSEGLIDWHA